MTYPKNSWKRDKNIFEEIIKQAEQELDKNEFVDVLKKLSKIKKQPSEPIPFPYGYHGPRPYNFNDELSWRSARRSEESR